VFLLANADRLGYIVKFVCHIEFEANTSWPYMQLNNQRQLWVSILPPRWRWQQQKAW